MKKGIILFILLSTFLLSDSKETTGDNSPIVESKGNVTINYNGSKIKELYPKILVDYLGTSIKKIEQDFGVADNEVEILEGNVGPGYVSDDYKGFFYSFDNGAINFYVKKGKKSATIAEVFINNTEVIVPYLNNKGSNYPNIILGKSIFKDIFSISTPKKLYSNEGSFPSSVYTEAEFYFGRFGYYANFTFGIRGYYKQNIENNYESLNNKKPDYVIVH